MKDGSVGRTASAGGWGLRLETRHLREFVELDKLFAIAVSREWIENTDRAKVLFFALARASLRKAKKTAGGYFTACLKNKSWDAITDEDEDKARAAIRWLRDRQIANCELDAGGN